MHVAQREKRHRRRHHEERDPPKARVEPAPDELSCPPASTARVAGHRRQLGRRHRHAEQADGQRVQQLRVGEPGDRAGRQQAGEQRVDVRAHLHDAPAEEHRHEVPRDGRAPASDAKVERQTAASGATRITVGSCTANCRALPTTDPHARSTARRGSVVARSEQHQRRDHRGVPHDRRGVRQQKAVMAVQHAQAPGRQHQQPGARKEDADEDDRSAPASRRRSLARSR